MLQYVKNVEKELDDISDWRLNGLKMQEKGITLNPRLRKINLRLRILWKGYTREKTPAHMCVKRT